MNSLELILHLRALGVRLWLEGEGVHFSAPRGVLTPELREQMKTHKDLLRDLLLRQGQQVEPRASGVVLPPIVPAPRDRPPPLSCEQQGLWIRWQMEPGGTTYNMPAAFRLRGALDLAALDRSIELMITRHEILRTTFRAHPDGPRQIIHAHLSFEMPLLDLSDLLADEREAALRAETERELRRPFDLTHGPLLRARLVRMGADEHVLLVTMHHIIADAWSVFVFVREAGLIYRALRAGEPPPLPPVAVHYADYALWQRRLLDSRALEPSLAFWKESLACAPRTLELHTARARAASGSSAGAALVFEISHHELAALRALGQRAGATLFMTLLAVFEVVLARNSGQDDFLLGTAVAGRGRIETEQMLGVLVNLVVLRVRLARDMRFLELLARVKDAVLQAQAHQHIPFEWLVQELAPERTYGRTPLVQAVFNFINTPRAELELPGLRVEPIELASETSKMDMSLAIAEHPDRLVCTMHYRTELYARATIERMARHYCNLVRAVVHDPEQRIADLPMLDREEQRLMVDAWNATRAERPANATLHGLVAAQVARTPGAIAVWSEQGVLTYGELAARAGRCARSLRARGIGAEITVAVCMERSLARVAWVLGILQAGAAYLPLPPEGPAARMRALLEDARAAIVIADAGLRSMFEHAPAAIIDGHAEPGLPGELAPLVPVSSEQLAYIIYTSGSTGRPKGVMVPHRAVCNHLLHRQDAYPLTPGDRFLHKASAVFDIALWELFAPLIAGASVVLARPGGQRDLAYLARLVTTSAATHIHFPPFLLERFLDEPPCPSVRRVFCGGEPMTGALAARFRARYPEAELIHQYGPTEATIDATMGPAAVASTEARVPIGKPIANTRVYVLDDSLEPVPLGTAGELYIGGHGVARAYLGSPALTASCFVPDPFADEPGMRLYRTGDRARWLDDGTLEFIGRRDHQVKIRGVRVELAEIDAALRQHPDILDCVTVLHGGAGSDKRLVAYLMPRHGAAPRPADVREYLLELLPEAMVPAAMMVLEDLPRTRTGKIDRAALPELEGPQRESSASYAEAQSELEQSLCAIFAEVLRVDRVGIHDDFFDSGGDSLVAMSLAARIQEYFGVVMDLGAFFATPTVAAVAAFLSRSSAAQEDVPPVVPLRVQGGRTRLFCLPPAGGQVIAYQRLAEWLDADIDVHGVQSRAVRDVARQLASVQGMVASYASAISEAQPQGPYYLLGWSMGGVLAVGVAHALEAQGERVAFVGLLDAYPGAFLAAHTTIDPLRGLTLALGGELTAAYEALGEDERALLHAAMAAAPPEQRLTRALAEARARGLMAPGLQHEQLDEQLRLIDWHRHLVEVYVPPVVHAPLDVWWAGDHGERPDWAAHTHAAARVEVLEGDHFSILREPRGRLLAAAVSARVHQVARERGIT